MRTGHFQAGQGMAPAVVWHEGRFVVAWQTWAPTTHLKQAVQTDNPDEWIIGPGTPIGSGAGAFVRLASVNGSLYRAARWGDEHDQRIMLERNNGVHVWRSPAPAGGNWPCVIEADGRVIWQNDETKQVWANHVNTTHPVRPTGIVPHHLLVGWTYWDANRFSEPGMTCPDRAGAWVVGEHPAHGVICRLGEKQVVIWSDLATPEPHCALSRDGKTLCVTVASQPDGLVRWALVQESDLAEPEPVPPPEPAPVVFDCGGPGDWPRLSSQFPGRQMHCVGWGDYRTFIKVPPAQRPYGVPNETWKLNAGHYEGIPFSRLCQDTPGPGRMEGYAWRLRRGWWVPMRPDQHVGRRFVFHDEISWLSHDDLQTWGPWLPWSYAITVTRADAERIEWDFEPGLVAETVEHYFAIPGNGWEGHYPLASPEKRDEWPTRGGAQLWPPDVATRFLDAEQTVAEPGVTVESYGDELQPGRPWAVQWRNRHESGTQRRVELRPTGDNQWSVHCHEANAAGSNTSGLTRTVRLVVESEPQPEPEPPQPPLEPGWYPTLDQIRQWDANFLCFEPEAGNDEFHYAFMYLAWADEKQRRFREKYGGKHTHLPLSPWGRYPGHGEYITPINPEAEVRGTFAILDVFAPEMQESQQRSARKHISAMFGLAGARYRNDMPAFAAKLRELLDAKIIPMVQTITDELDGSDVTIAEAREMVDKLATIPEVIPAISPGWEINQIAGGWGQGAQQLELARYIAEKLPNAVRYVHFSPERITGYPNYPDHSGPQDEALWWREARCTSDVPWEQRIIHGILYQRPHDEAVEYVVAHTIGGRSQDGSTDIGDYHRLRPGGSWNLSADFVLFEHSRTLERYNEIVNAVRGSGIQGWG